jgi:protein phosphatase
MNLRGAARTDVGLRRRANEDTFALVPELGLYLVADGMGGHTAGQVASELAAGRPSRPYGPWKGPRQPRRTNSATRWPPRTRDPRDREGQAEFAGMGTTMVALLAAEERIALAHVGDSRAYLIRSGKIRQLTDDHSLVAELVRRREITQNAARGHPHRHVLTRALGVRRSVEPDLAELTPAPFDSFVLCSDGLTGHLRDEEIADVVSQPEADVESVCDQLVNLANRAAARTTSQCVVVRVEKEAD